MAVFWPTPCYQENIHQLWGFYREDLKISVSAVPHYKDTVKTEMESCTEQKTVTADLQTTWTVYFDGQGTQILPCHIVKSPGGGDLGWFMV